MSPNPGGGGGGGVVQKVLLLLLLSIISHHAQSYSNDINSDEEDLTTASITSLESSTTSSSSISSLTVSSSSYSEISEIPYQFYFAHPIYNVTIPENSVGKIYATQPSHETRMGINLNENDGGVKSSSLEVKYRIVGGDKDKFFKAEERIVGDFAFLTIRTRTNNVQLNREKGDRYRLEVEAIGTRRAIEGGSSSGGGGGGNAKNSNSRVTYKAEAIVDVRIEDKNDLSPLFYPTKYSITIADDTPLHQSILKVSAEDADLGINGEIYYSLFDETEQFSIHPTSGVLTLTRPLIYTEKSYHQLTVLASDRGSLLLNNINSNHNYKINQAKANVEIFVQQTNLHSPEIYVQALSDIVENSNANVYGIVRVEDQDAGIHGEIKSLEIVDGDPDGNFRIKSTSRAGEYVIEVHKLLDREQAPNGYNLTLRAEDSGLPQRQSYKSIPVRLADDNDNTPVFNREIYEVSVPETSPPNTPVIRLKVSDRDEGRNAQVYLTITGGNENSEFRINPETGMLYTATTLDAETKPFYTLTVSAIDQGNTGTRKQSSAKVKINVADSNDNDPIFETSNMTIWVDENEPAGIIVTKVTARDRDSGENAYISYSIANLNEVPFDIDHFSGSVRTSKLLDYESMRREYVLHVRASDWGLPYRRQTEMKLFIKLRDVNDNRPQFERIDCIGRIPRSLSIGAELITLSAIDFDAGNIISYRLVSGNEDGCFNLDSASGLITLGCDLNDLGVDQREVNVTATDGTHFADTARLQINLIRGPSGGSKGNFECRDTGVTRRLAETMAIAEKNNIPGRETNSGEDFAMMPSRYGENIHAPEFVDMPLEIKVNETAPLGTTIAFIKARDRDLGYNGKLVYGISGGDNDSVFRLDPETGELKVIGYLDREREDEYLLNITVYDLGKPQKSIAKMLPVTVLDENDNAPKFEKSLASFRVTENALNNTIIIRLNATDKDLGPNGKVTYSLVTDTPDFTIDRETGILSISAPLDREKQDLYELKVRATDGGGRKDGEGDGDYISLSSEALVQIKIEDINDNQPKFHLSDYVVRVREDIPKGTVVAVVTANDLDLGTNGEIAYTFGEEGGDGEGCFKIDKISGTIRTAKQLDFEERQIHSLTIKAIDKGIPSLSSETSVIVEVIDVNENRFAPQFEDFVVSGSVKENQKPGTHVMKVAAKDGDVSGPDSRISYSARGGNGLGLFTIDNEGNIRTLVKLDAEMKSNYWLTICAQDHAIVPLHSCTQVFIEIENENDNVPLTDQPVYYPTVMESSPAGTKILQLRADDKDNDAEQKISYRITSGNPEGFFALNGTTGLITTTSRKLDRENQPEHILEVMVMDNGSPQLSSTTRIVINVGDLNDHSPKFDLHVYNVQIPSTAQIDQKVFQDDPIAHNFDQSVNVDSSSMKDNSEYHLEMSTWELYSKNDIFDGLQPIIRVLAFDKDVGENGRITYSIKSGRGKAKFRIHPDTGVVYLAKALDQGPYDLLVKAEDNGTPKKSHTARINVTVKTLSESSLNPPVIKSTDQAEVTESDAPGYLVTLLQATDEDADQLWYDITSGNDDNEFYIGRENGNVLVAKSLDCEKKKEYNLTISVTDGTHIVYTQLYISVICSVNHRPEFTESLYRVEISESVEEETEILQLHATDADEDKKLFYSLHAVRNPISLKLFRVDSVTGKITLQQKLDREIIAEHVLIVIVKDQGTPAKRNYAKVIITVHDHNNRVPEFTSKLVQAKVYETAAIGTQVVQVYAIDRDLGENSRLTYSIVSGNIGNAFSIDSNMGIVSVIKELDLNALPEYMLQVKASDNGKPSLSSQIPVHIMVNMADNAPPRFLKQDRAAEIYENLPLGTFVKHIEARSTSSLVFEIIDGNTEDIFFINPSTGIITTKDYVDYETNKFFNLTIRATNMASASENCFVIIQVLDQNDNAPYFEKDIYRGEITESSPIGSLVNVAGDDGLAVNVTIPLVIKARDLDSGQNALLHYDIIEFLPRKFFHIDSTTGAIKTVMILDHEKIPFYSFNVKVTDLGKPRLSSSTIAKVEIRVNDVNDCAPQFTQKSYNVTLLLPTYENVVVIQVNATDRDTTANSTLRFDIIDGNADKNFQIDAINGIITTRSVDHIGSFYKLHIRVSDGKFSTISYVYINVETSENSGLVFQKPIYENSIVENSTKISIVTVVNVLGSSLNEHIEFKILNPTDLFKIGLTSGVIETTGQRFDREEKDNYELIIEAKSQFSDSEKPRVAHVVVNVTVTDINDNCPMFVNLPYYAVVSIDDPKGSVITKVHAVDLDSYENGEVRYEMKKGHGELFKVERKTGEIVLRQTLEGHNRDYQLLIAAYDGGNVPCSTDVTVHVKVIDKSMPVFNKQFYSDTVAENIELHSPLSVSIEAESPLNRKLIYSIVKGNELEEFAVDFNTAPDQNKCAIYVVDELDFEQKSSYELVIRAIDSVSGVSAEVPVSVLVTDVNDCPPELPQDNYNITVSESSTFGTVILKVQAQDNDMGINSQITYSIQTDNKNSSEYFHIDGNEGSVYLKKSLDHELLRTHHFTIVATDRGLPSLSSTAHVFVTVIDSNDNPPKFEQQSYSCVLSEQASRGQFVIVVSASDPDYIDQKTLVYTIVEGNDDQTYDIDPANGIITLTNMQNFADKHMTMLNVSVTDGVYTSYTRVKITILPANLHNPYFEQQMFDVRVNENQMAGRLVQSLKATDKDFGEYSRLTYTIVSDEMQEYFNIDNEKGDVITKIKLDREAKKFYDILVMATDAGGKSGFTNLRVNVADVNDMSPEFICSEYKAVIHGNLTKNITFLKIKAIDLDENQNAAIKYSIYDSQNKGVKDLFGINENTGGVFLRHDAERFENQIFQFFVRATDCGTPSLHADVPVDVYVMASSENPPVFEKKEKDLFLSENSEPGTVISYLKLTGNVTARYRIISTDDKNEPQFAINDDGELRLAKTLDRETKDSHYIVVLAETDSSPPLTAVMEIVLRVQDENDNSPIFESNLYSLLLAENVDKGSSILKVHARDADSGPNGDVRYSLASDAGDIVNIFDIDSYTGWLTTLVPLDKEKQGEFKFHVMGTDNASGQKHSAKTTVSIKLKDYNNYPPEFKKQNYKTSVSEDSLPGTVLLQLEITDKDMDLNTPIDYYIIAGDTFSQFQIRTTGELFVVKSLDRESISSYELTVLVTDGKFTSQTTVSITVIDTNDNPPYCLKYRYRETLSEGIDPGTHVLEVLSSDADEPANSRLRFYLTGNGAEEFILDEDSGFLKTARSLDREIQSKFLLTAHVQDRDHPGWECSSQIEITISDLNDNAPQFAMNPYNVFIPEDAEVGTLITKVLATDIDVGVNRKIKYSFVDSHNEHFKVSSDSGIVTLMKPLDREQKASYNVTLKATDQGIPRLSSTVSLLINIKDVNDNPPEFMSKHYFATISEASEVATSIIRLLATSKDTGINAEISYSIIGGNEHRKFSVDNKTGLLTLQDVVDFERSRDYFLTIQAMDHGAPPLSNLATVNISITDSNDNSPTFTQGSYSARIREDAQINDKILQVRANDLDSEDNGRIRYSIERGDRMEQFKIEEDTGYIFVANGLDREITSSYVLEIVAKDCGFPELSSYVLVNIEISDANDNVPIFSKSNYTTVVQENKPIGHPLMKFDVTDADTSPNGDPFTFEFLGGNENGAFRIDEQDGVLKTASRFNHKIKDTHVLKIRVFDNGLPPLYSDTIVVVKVIEESQYPPTITPLEISINSFFDEHPGGKIGRVFAKDKDTYDTLTFDLAPTTGVLFETNSLFNISKTDGTLYAFPRLDVGDYRLNVTVSDNKFTSFAIVKVSVELITDEMLTNAVAIRFSKVTPEDFISSHRKGFIRSIRTVMNSRVKDIILISVQRSSDVDHEDLYRRKRSTDQNDSLDVLFTVRKSENGVNGFYSTEEIQKTVEDNSEEIEETSKLKIDEILKAKCAQNYCIHGECEHRVAIDSKFSIPIATEVISFVSAHHEHRIECNCKTGYGGDKCQLAVNECSKNHCQLPKKCEPDVTERGFHCSCPDGFFGINCDKESNKCNDDNCYAPKNPVTFTSKSYALYSIDKSLARKALEDQIYLQLRIRTVQPTGNLMFAAGRVDYNILEVQNGVVQYRFDLGSGEGLISVTSVFVSDGLWHDIRLEREGNSARLIVDGKHTRSGMAPGVNGILNLQIADLFFGAEVRRHPTVIGIEDVQRGFVGCMDDLNLSQKPLPLQMNKASNMAVLKRFANVDFNCDAGTVLIPMGLCGTQPCFNGGTCKEINNGVDYECLCHGRFSGKNCQEDRDPCASAPCLYGGKCRNEGFGNYTCDCPVRMMGKRCDFGRFCLPNPCRNGGVCEEGDDAPLCMCRGYTGKTCEIDVDECENQPCGSGATCLNEAGSFRCVCPHDLTGVSCGDPLYSNSIISNLTNMTVEQMVAIIAGIAILLLLLICCCFCCFCRRRRPRTVRNVNKNNAPPTILNSEYKRVSKMSNLEVIQQQQRPASYSATPDHHNPPITVLQYNNLDTLRSYGSAGDELENVPPEYRKINRNPMSQQMVNINNTTGNSSDTDGSSISHKQMKWSDAMHMQTFSDNTKINNDLKRMSPMHHHHHHQQQQQQQQQQLQQQQHQQQHQAMYKHPAGGILPGRLMQSGGYEPEQTGYEWDVSDWKPRSMNALPNITEVPGNEVEVPDSSSFHSNESNESHSNKHSMLPPPMMVDPVRDIETLNEDIESEFPDDSECDRSEQPLSINFDQSMTYLNPLDSGSEDYRFNTADSYLRHPNSYLPKYNIQSETDGESMPLTTPHSHHQHNVMMNNNKMDRRGLNIGPHQIVQSDEDEEDDGIQAYGFPSQQMRRNRVQQSDFDLELSNGGEQNSLLGHASLLQMHSLNSGQSNSDLSVQLCEIDDSEIDEDQSLDTATNMNSNNYLKSLNTNTKPSWTKNSTQTDV